MAVLMPEKLQDFLDKPSGPRKNCFLEQDGASQATIERNTPQRCLHPDGMARPAVHVSLSHKDTNHARWMLRVERPLGGACYQDGPVAQVVRAHA
ncbi:hypothetical protein C7U60_19170 [Mesorhizobium plurifarium]|nr:hypothetical protein C7U60_19170 [Mesorhizobium plurifarium]